MRLPSPLTVAIGVASVCALARAPARDAPPAGTIADDRIADRVEGVVTGLPIATPHGYGALVDAGATTIGVGTGERLEPGERVAVPGRLRTPRGLLDPGMPPQLARAPFELAADGVERLGFDDSLAARTWRWAGDTQRAWAARIDDAVGDRRDPGAAGLRGLVPGDRGDLPRGLDQRWPARGIFP